MLVFLFRLLSHLPLVALHLAGSALGWLVYGLVPAHRYRLDRHLSRAGYSTQWRQAVAESGKGILELAFVWCAAPRRVLHTAQVDSWEVAQRAFDRGRGVIFLTPHLGCFEIIAQAIAARVPLTALYRPPRMAALKPLMEGARARPNLLLAPANVGGVRTLLRALKCGGAIGLLPDQVPQNGDGVWADFFGIPAYTMTLPARLQQITGATIILSYAQRLPHGRGFVIRFVPCAPLALRGGDSPQGQARALNRAMEELIARCPAQYFWSYNRYKTPAGVQPPSATATSS
ncbi:MAG: lysophospholipid acyltransferase family protein [Burkholderiaceae bacterium]